MTMTRGLRPVRLALAVWIVATVTLAWGFILSGLNIWQVEGPVLPSVRYDYAEFGVWLLVAAVCLPPLLAWWGGDSGRPRFATWMVALAVLVAVAAAPVGIAEVHDMRAAHRQMHPPAPPPSRCVVYSGGRNTCPGG